MKANYIENLLIMLNVFSIMFSFIFGNQLYFLIITFILSIFIVKPKIIKIYNIDKRILFLISIFFFNSFFSIDLMSSLKYVFMFTLCWLNIRILYELKSDWKIKFLNYLFISTMIHSISVIIHFINPQLIYSFLGNFYNQDSLLIINELANLGAFSGLCNQTGLAGFIVSIFIILSFIKIDYSNKKTLYSLFVFIGFAALFLTGKRGFVIFDIMMIFIYFLFFQKGNIKKKFIYIIALIFLAYFGFCILSKIGILNSFINKITILEKAEDLSNGRDILWKSTINVFKENPILGNGINTIDLLFDDCTHNIYIQLLAELGIIGSAAVICWFILNFISTTKKFFLNKNISNICSLFLQFLFLLYGFTGNPFYSCSFLSIYFLSLILSEEKRKINYEKD